MIDLDTIGYFLYMQEQEEAPAGDEEDREQPNPGNAPSFSGRLAQDIQT